MSDRDINTTSYDRILRAWENSKELVRDYQMYSKAIDDDEIQEVFKRFAEDEGEHAAELRDILAEYQQERQ